MTTRPRALIVTPDFPPDRGGIQATIFEVTRRLRRFDAQVLTLGHPDAAAFDADSLVRTRRIRRRRDHRASVAGLNLSALRTAIRRRPDVVLVGHVAAAPAAIAVRRAFGVPFVLYTHADEFEMRPGLTRRAIAAAARTIAVSNYTARLARDLGAQPGAVSVIHPGVETPSSSVVTSPRGGTEILTVSRLAEEYKGHDMAIAAMEAVRDAVPAVRWTVVGDGALRQGLEARVIERGLIETVRFAGDVPAAQRDAHFAASDVFLMPSRLRPGGGGGEGFGIVYLEAASYGLPVVAGAVAGALDAVENGVTGLLVDPEDPAAIAGALIRLLRDRDMAARLGAAGAARAKRFTWDATAQKVEDLLLAAVGPT